MFEQFRESQGDAGKMNRKRALSITCFERQNEPEKEEDAQ